jgi:molybdenum cofactor cytidylyltransferase
MTSSFSHIGAVILAAGPSSRMGRPKLALTHGGVPLLRRAVNVAVEGGCGQVVVVLGAGAEAYAPLLEGTPARIVRNPHYAEGMGGSIQLGVEALDQDVEAAVIMLADQPFIDAAIVRRIIDTYQTSGKKIVACEYDGVRGAPVLFDRALFLELLLVTGDRGARAVMDTYPKHVAAVEIPSAAARDVDTPADVERLRETD